MVVGAGIVGLFSALFYKRRHPSHQVLVLERGPYPSGASMKNAGFACFGSPSELLSDMAKEGQDAALLRVEERWRGLLELRRELGDTAIGFEPSGGNEVYRFNDPLYTSVREGFDALNQALHPIFGTTAFHWDNSAIGRFGFKGVEHLCRTDLEGPMDTGRMMTALLGKVLAEGVLFRPSTDVTSVEGSTHGVRISLRSGEPLEADQLLMATNGYTAAVMPELDVVPARGQVLLTSPIPGLRLRGTYHLDEGFYYFRDQQGGVLLGGGRHLDLAGETTQEEGVTGPIQQALEDLLRTMILPDTPFTIAQRWSGIMGFGTNTKAPIIKRTSERVAVAVRLGGMGVAIGIRVARKAVDLLDT